MIDGIKVETGKNGRHKNDLYMTQEQMTRELMTRVPIQGKRVCEPCAGHGHIAGVLDAFDCRVFTNDKVDRGGLNWVGDAADPGAAVWNWGPGFYDWVVTNPPYSLALPVLRNAWDMAGIGVAMLLRLSFLEPTSEAPAAYKSHKWADQIAGRGEWLADHENYFSDLIVFGSPRPSFTVKGTDSVTTAWLVWKKRQVYGLKPHFVMGWK